MKCSEIQSNLAFCVDGFVDETVKVHLKACPLCRQHYADFREIKTGLRQIRRPAISAALKNSIKQNVRAERRSSRSSWLPFSPEARVWLQMRPMPYSVGVFASCLVGITFLTMMFSGMLKTGNTSILRNNAGPEILLASNSNPFRDQNAISLSPSEYSKTRLAFANESPSINPQGALIALTKSLVRGGMKDDEVVVVADVFGNGLAQIAEVVEPSRDRRAVMELEKALDSDPSYAPFVPSSMENRPENMRVVLKFQSVNVKTSPRSNRRQK